MAQWIENPPANVGDAGDSGSMPGLGGSPGGGHGNLLQHSCLENFEGREARRATVQGIIKSQTQLSSRALMNSLTQPFATIRCSQYDNNNSILESTNTSR